MRFREASALAVMDADSLTLWMVIFRLLLVRLVRIPVTRSSAVSVIAAAHAVSRTKPEVVAEAILVAGVNGIAEVLPHLFAMLSNVANVTVVLLAAFLMTAVLLVAEVEVFLIAPLAQEVEEVCAMPSNAVNVTVALLVVFLMMVLLLLVVDLTAHHHVQAVEEVVSAMHFNVVNVIVDQHVVSRMMDLPLPVVQVDNLFAVLSNVVNAHVVMVAVTFMLN
jgi:hypothetical protein